MIAIVAAMRREARPLQRGVPPGASVAWVLSGVGAHRAVDAMRRYLETNRPDAILSIGLAGALHRELRGGELVLCQQVSLWQQGTAVFKPVACDADLLHRARAALSDAGVPYRLGECATTPRPAASPQERDALGRATGASVADMEGYWVGRAAQEHGIPFLAVRAVVDAYDQRVPTLVYSLAGAPTWAQWLGAAAGVLAIPWYVPSLIRLAKNARRADEALRAFGSACVAGDKRLVVAPGRGA